MSGICEKHHGYVQPGEVCPYCEPAAEPAPRSGPSVVQSCPTYLGKPVVLCPATLEPPVSQPAITWIEWIE